MTTCSIYLSKRRICTDTTVFKPFLFCGALFQQINKINETGLCYTATTASSVLRPFGSPPPSKARCWSTAQICLSKLVSMWDAFFRADLRRFHWNDLTAPQISMDFFCHLGLRYHTPSTGSLPQPPFGNVFTFIQIELQKPFCLLSSEHHIHARLTVGRLNLSEIKYT